VSEILGFSSISHAPVSGPKWASCLARVRSNRVRADVSSLPRIFLGPRSGPKWAPCLTRVRSNRVRADVSSLPRIFLGPRKGCHVRLNSSGPCQYETGLNLDPSFLGCF
ncbi:hypothetical protein Tco_1472758, partial [Tanacetum coccineum]